MCIFGFRLLHGTAFRFKSGIYLVILVAFREGGRALLQTVRADQTHRHSFQSKVITMRDDDGFEVGVFG